MLVGVAGTPLVVQPERVLVRGLRERQWRTALDWGQLPRGVEASKTFYVFNTGSLGGWRERWTGKAHGSTTSNILYLPTPRPVQ